MNPMQQVPPHLFTQEEKQTQFSNPFYLKYQAVDEV
jgi:hypothetical protein